MLDSRGWDTAAQPLQFIIGQASSSTLAVSASELADPARLAQASEGDDDEDAADDDGPVAARLAYQDELEYLSEYEGYFDDGAMYENYDELFESEEQLALPDEVSGAVCPPDIAGDQDTVGVPEGVTVCSLQELD